MYIIMCGICAVLYNNNNNGFDIFQALISIQHRGQDGAGIYYCNDNFEKNIKKSGLICDIFHHDQLNAMNAHTYLGHTRYKTNSIYNSFQPFNFSHDNITIKTNKKKKRKPFYISLCHNGNIINTDHLISILSNQFDYHFNSPVSDSFILTVLIFYKLTQYSTNQLLNFSHIIHLSKFLNETIVGSFSLIINIRNYGIIAIRDQHGIRPLSYGKNDNDDILISSESCSFNNTNFHFISDVNPGETILFQQNKSPETFMLSHNSYTIFKPCLFEYIYFSRLDSIIAEISVYNFRFMLGELLAKIIDLNDIDFIIPTPETSRVYAYGLSSATSIPIQECIIRNRYINRTFILDDKNQIEKKINQKFSVVSQIVKDKNVILIDDSIVRGNTSKKVIELLKQSGANKVIFASASPKIFNTNNFGIFIENKDELITFPNKTNDDIANSIGAHKVYYNNLEDVLQIIKYLNPFINNMEISMFLK